MNKEFFVTYEQAIALKKLGFSEKCLYYYDIVSKDELMPNMCYIEYDNTNTDDLYYSHNKEDLDDICDAPTLSEAQKWLRLNKNAIIYPYIFEYFENIDDINAKVSKAWTYALDIDNEDKTSDTYISRKYNTPEEALSAGITECFKFLN